MRWGVLSCTKDRNGLFLLDKIPNIELDWEWAFANEKCLIRIWKREFCIVKMKYLDITRVFI